MDGPKVKFLGSGQSRSVVVLGSATARDGGTESARQARKRVANVKSMVLSTFLLDCTACTVAVEHVIPTAHATAKKWVGLQCVRARARGGNQPMD